MDSIQIFFFHLNLASSYRLSINSLIYYVLIYLDTKWAERISFINKSPDHS